MPPKRRPTVTAKTTAHGVRGEGAQQQIAQRCCELCRCGAAEATDRAAERGAAVSDAFPSGFREEYCCSCYDKLVRDIAETKAAQVAREAREKREQEMKQAREEKERAAAKAEVGADSSDGKAEKVDSMQGTVVIVSGLVGAPELNGRVGIVQGCDDVSGRYIIRIADEERKKKLKLANITGFAPMQLVRSRGDEGGASGADVEPVPKMVGSLMIKTGAIPSVDSVGCGSCGAVLALHQVVSHTCPGRPTSVSEAAAGAAIPTRGDSGGGGGEAFVRNGGRTERYLWAQESGEVTVAVVVPPETRASAVVLEIQDKVSGPGKVSGQTLAVGLRGADRATRWLVKGPLAQKVVVTDDPTDIDWEVRDLPTAHQAGWNTAASGSSTGDAAGTGLWRAVVVTLKKEAPAVGGGVVWWKTVIEGDTEIDTSQFAGPSSPPPGPAPAPAADGPAVLSFNDYMGDFEHLQQQQAKYDGGGGGESGGVLDGDRSFSCIFCGETLQVSSEEAALKHMEGCSQLHAYFDEQGTAAATAASASSGGLASSEMAASGFVSDVRNTLQKQRQREAERQQ